MGVRTSPNEKPRVAIIGSICFGVIVAAMIYWELRPARAVIPKTNVYYTDDDGKSWFEGPAAKITPFDHSGKQAVRCFLYQTSSGQTFVGYEQRLTDQAKALMESSPEAIAGLHLAEVMVKRPGETEWHLKNSESGMAVIQHVHALDGSVGDPLLAGAP